MRFNVFAVAALLPAAGLLSGCAMGTQGVTSAVPSAAVKTISGKSFGGQQAVAGGQIVVYQYGAGGYGSAGTAIASTITDSAGNFTVDYTCSSPTAPVYILSIGGQPGLNLPNNPAIVLGAGLGSCEASESGYVTINEISTTVLAFSLSHFFSSPSGPNTTAVTSDQYTNDHFGSPSDLTAAITRVNSVLIPTLQSVQNGYPNSSTSTVTIEGAKMITVADILGACVNSENTAASASGPAMASPACSTLFQNTTAPGGAAPIDTLQAAVNMALYPSQNVANLYSLVPPSGSSAFSGSLSTQPNDWTLAVSYATSSLGLGINPYTVTTLDIDTTGRVWFPSNLTGAAGVAYFDPNAGSFSAAFPAPGIVRPEQVVVDEGGYVWTNDVSSANVAGYPVTGPTSPQVLSLPGTTSTALTVGDDDSIRVALLDASTAEAQLAEITNETTYAAIPNTSAPGSQGYIGVSLAGDLVGGTGASAADVNSNPNAFDLYYSPSDVGTAVLFQSFADGGQVAFTGNDFVSALGGFNAPSDGICIFSRQGCFSFANQTGNHHPTGLAVDGGGNLWLADQFSSDVQEVVPSGGSYVNASGLANNLVFEHGTNNGATLAVPGGIGIDNTGNVWVSNVSCLTTNCTPGSFILSEIIGAGVPTITPVSGQVVLNSAPGVEPTSRPSTSKQPK